MNDMTWALVLAEDPTLAGVAADWFEERGDMATAALLREPARDDTWLPDIQLPDGAVLGRWISNERHGGVCLRIHTVGDENYHICPIYRWSPDQQWEMFHGTYWERQAQWPAVPLQQVPEIIKRYLLASLVSYAYAQNRRRR